MIIFAMRYGNIGDFGEIEKINSVVWPNNFGDIAENHSQEFCTIHQSYTLLTFPTWFLGKHWTRTYPTFGKHDQE